MDASWTDDLHEVHEKVQWKSLDSTVWKGPRRQIAVLNVIDNISAFWYSKNIIITKHLKYSK